MAHLTNEEAVHFMDELARAFPCERAVLERTPLAIRRLRTDTEPSVMPTTRVFVVRLLKSSFYADDIKTLQEIIDKAGTMGPWADGYGFSWRIQELVTNDQRGHWHLPSPAFIISKQ